MQHDVVTAASANRLAWLWLRDAASLVLVWMRGLLRLGAVIAFGVGVAALLLVKSVVRVFGHPS
jgi:hypothetical protein